MTLLPKRIGNWGNAVQDPNLVFARLAVQRHLIEPGKSPGSPSEHYFLAFAALIFAHLAVMVADNLALASALIVPFFF